MKTLPFTLIPLFAAWAAAPAETPSSGTEVAKDHHIFVGVQLELPHEDHFYPMIGMGPAGALLKVDGETVGKTISTIENFRFSRQTKVSRHFVELEKVECVPAYSAAAAPTLRSFQAQNLQTDEATRATDDAARAQVELDQARIEVENAERDVTIGGQYRRDSAQRGLQTARANVATTNQGYTNQLGRTGVEVEEIPKDILRVSFNIRADQVLDDAHVVLILRLKEQRDAEVSGAWIHFRSLPRIGPDFRRVSFQETSFPDGAHVDSYELYLYAEGNEVATNLSSKRVDMTREEARMFLLYRYLAEHDGETLPPVPVWPVFGTETSERLEPKVLESPLSIAVSAEGKVTNVRLHRSASEALSDAFLDRLLNALFYPALKEGEPVEGELDLRLRDLVL